MNWKEKVIGILLEGELKKQRLKQTKHGRRPLTLTYKRGGKMKGKKTLVGKGFVATGKGPTGKPKGTYTGKPTRRSTTSPTPGWKTQDDAPTVPPMGKPGSPKRERYNQYKSDAGIR